MRTPSNPPRTKPGPAVLAWHNARQKSRELIRESRALIDLSHELIQRASAIAIRMKSLAQSRGGEASEVPDAK
ncbi:MAG TPA: hypothetical protein VEI01_16750 [Terriglobales bacterium]|nr:hypothetical protein [Terriglobales bacterium]